MLAFWLRKLLILLGLGSTIDIDRKRKEFWVLGSGFWVLGSATVSYGFWEAGRASAAKGYPQRGRSRKGKTGHPRCCHSYSHSHAESLVYRRFGLGFAKKLSHLLFQTLDHLQDLYDIIWLFALRLDPYRKKTRVSFSPDFFGGLDFRNPNPYQKVEF
jgi:hypothetical protein